MADLSKLAVIQLFERIYPNKHTLDATQCSNTELSIAWYLASGHVGHYPQSSLTLFQEHSWNEKLLIAALAAPLLTACVINPRLSLLQSSD